MRLPRIFLVAALVLAGCASPVEPTSQEANAGPATWEVAYVEEGTATPTREERFAWGGVIPSWGYACAWTVSRCVTTPYPEESPQEKPLPPANYRHAKLTLTWNPTGPTNRELRLILLNVTTQPDGAEEWSILAQAQAGPSPVVLDTELSPLDERTEVVVFVGGVALDQPASETAGGSYYTEQPFHVEGVMLVNETRPATEADA